MSAPTGAKKVTYGFHTFPDPDSTGGGGELMMSFTGDVSDATHDRRDAALEAAGDAVVAYIQANYPRQEIRAARTYECDVTGAVWP